MPSSSSSALPASSRRLETPTVLNATISWNYTTYLNIVFIAVALVLVWRFVRTGGITMLKMMGGSPAPAGAA